MSNVVKLEVKPKSIKLNHKQTKFTVTYIPATKQWRWDVELVHVTRFGDVADTQIKAINAAKRHIEKMKAIQGVG